MWTRLWTEVDALHLVTGLPQPEAVTDAELAALPPAAREYLAFFGVTAGSRKHWSFAVGWKGRFRMAPSAPWMRIEAVQYNTRSPVARIFHMKARMKGLPVFGRDTYVRGTGRMLGKIAGLITVADGSGPEFDTSELVTWLDDVALFAPSMLLAAGARWSPVDARSFSVAITDGGRTVTGRVTLDDRGAPVTFETTDRYTDDPSRPGRPLVRGRWSTPVESWLVSGGQPVPGRAQAIWHLPAGDFPYGEFEVVPGTVVFDVLPGEGKRAA